MMLFTFSTFSLHSIERGKAGQTSSVSFAGILAEHTSCRLSRRGDPKTMHRQRRHTCTSVCHPSIRYASRTKKSNICSRTSSGSMSIESHQCFHTLLVTFRHFLVLFCLSTSRQAKQEAKFIIRTYLNK